MLRSRHKMSTGTSKNVLYIFLCCAYISHTLYEKNHHVHVELQKVSNLIFRYFLRIVLYTIV